METLWFASVSASLRACSLFPLPKAFAVLLRVVDPPAGFSACLVFCEHTMQAGRPGWYLGWWEGGVLPPLLQTQLHTTPYSPQATAVSVSSLVSTAHSLSLSLSLSASIATRLLHTSPKHAGRINVPSGEWWCVFGGRVVKNLFRLGKSNTSFVFLGLLCLVLFCC